MLLLGERYVINLNDQRCLSKDGKGGREEMRACVRDAVVNDSYIMKLQYSTSVSEELYLFENLGPQRSLFEGFYMLLLALNFTFQESNSVSYKSKSHSQNFDHLNRRFLSDKSWKNQWDHLNQSKFQLRVEPYCYINLNSASSKLFLFPQ